MLNTGARAPTPERPAAIEPAGNQRGGLLLDPERPRAITLAVTDARGAGVELDVSDLEFQSL